MDSAIDYVVTGAYVRVEVDPKVNGYRLGLFEVNQPPYWLCCCLQGHASVQEAEECPEAISRTESL